MKSTKTFPARLLYYRTFVLHLFFRIHLWLVAVALVTAIPYSGEATIHTILTAPCPITVSLLNWSDTLRQLGQKAASMEEGKSEKTTSDVGTRIIVSYDGWQDGLQLWGNVDGVDKLRILNYDVDFVKVVGFTV